MESCGAGGIHGQRDRQHRQHHQHRQHYGQRINNENVENYKKLITDQVDQGSAVRSGGSGECCLIGTITFIYIAWVWRVGFERFDANSEPSQ